MGFDGFGEHTADFYEGLTADNSKAYWSDHKAVYDDQIRAPMLALLGELEPEFGTGKIFRPHRDVRFSKDIESLQYALRCCVPVAVMVAGRGAA